MIKCNAKDVTPDMIKLVEKYKAAGGCVGSCFNLNNKNGHCFDIVSVCPFSSMVDVNINCRSNIDKIKKIKGHRLFNIDSKAIVRFLNTFGVTIEDISED